MLKFLLASGVIMVVMLGWVLVQQFARDFARRHPEWGPYREKVGCGGHCSCGNSGSCKKR
ncbi:MAG: hypothetical protein ABW116_00325 [Candidatus Sedimenticola sp. 20ELBAFRAG]